MGNDTAVCAGELIELNAEGVGLNYTWNTGGEASTIMILNEGVYDSLTTKLTKATIQKWVADFKKNPKLKNK